MLPLWKTVKRKNTASIEGVIMSQATKLGAVEKAEIVKRYLVGEIGQNEAARIAGVVPAPFVLWVNKYKNDGVLGLAPQGKNNIYKHRAEASSGKGLFKWGRQSR